MPSEKTQSLQDTFLNHVRKQKTPLTIFLIKISSKTMTMIGEYSEEHLLKTAKEAVWKKTCKSTLLDPEAELRIPKFDEKGK